MKTILLYTIGVIHEGEVSKRLNLPGIPSLSESVQIARDVLLAEATGCHYHVCHVSTKESVRVIREQRRPVSMSLLKYLHTI